MHVSVGVTESLVGLACLAVSEFDLQEACRG